jgi:cobalamin biosynthesis protein CbiG
VKFVAPEQIEKIQNLPNPSPYAQKALGVQGVAEPSALWVAESQTLLVEKRKFQNVTVAVALKEKTI